jgi:hypothetical protein
MDEDACRLKQIGSQQTISPSRDLAVGVRFARLLATRREAEISTDFRCRAKARRIIDGVPERQGCHYPDAWNSHEALCRFIGPRKATDLMVQFAFLRADLQMDCKQWLDDSKKWMALVYQLEDLSMVNLFVNARLKKFRQMRWSPNGRQPCYKQEPLCLIAG